MKIFEKKDDKNLVGHWIHYYIFGKKVYTKFVCLWKYE